MEKDTHKTQVIFLVHKIDKELFAYFPKEKYNEDPNLYTCYAHIGQHSACHIDYAKESRLARKTEYEELYNELTGLGYNLDILKNRYSLYQS